MRTAIIGVLLLFSMLSTVYFNGEAQARAIEIKREWPDRMLPPEMKAIKLVTAKCMPQPIFSISHVPAKISRARSHPPRAREA